MIKNIDRNSLMVGAILSGLDNGLSIINIDPIKYYYYDDYVKFHNDIYQADVPIEYLTIFNEMKENYYDHQLDNLNFKDALNILVKLRNLYCHIENNEIEDKKWFINNYPEIINSLELFDLQAARFTCLFLQRVDASVLIQSIDWYLTNDNNFEDCLKEYQDFIKRIESLKMKNYNTEIDYDKKIKEFTASELKEIVINLIGNNPLITLTSVTNEEIDIYHNPLERRLKISINPELPISWIMYSDFKELWYKNIFYHENITIGQFRNFTTTYIKKSYRKLIKQIIKVTYMDKEEFDHAKKVITKKLEQNIDNKDWAMIVQDITWRNVRNSIYHNILIPDDLVDFYKKFLTTVCAFRTDFNDCSYEELEDYKGKLGILFKTLR